MATKKNNGTLTQKEASERAYRNNRKYKGEGDELARAMFVSGIRYEHSRRTDKEAWKAKLNKVIGLQKEADNFIDKCHDAGIDLFETTLYENFSKMTDDYIMELCGGDKELFDDVQWYIFEYLPHLEENDAEPCKENAMAHDGDDNPILYDMDSLAEWILAGA
jgi:hypothetical protein